MVERVTTRIPIAIFNTKKKSSSTKIFSYKKLIRKILQHIDIEKIEQRIDFKIIFVTIARWHYRYLL